MHWFTDMMLGDLAGLAIGFGAPLLLFWKCGKGETSLDQLLGGDR